MARGTLSETVYRHWAMLATIPAGEWMSTVVIVERLAAQGFAVSARQVQHDLAEYAAAGSRFPLEVNAKSKPYQYRWKAGAKVQPVPAMDLQTAVTFDVVERLLEARLPASTTKHLGPYFKHAQTVLKRERTAGKKLASWSSKVHVVPEGPLRPYPLDARVRDAVCDGLARELCLRVQYRKRDADRTKGFLVSPLGLIFQGSRMALVYCRPDLEGDERNDPRTLLLHRMASAKVVDEPPRHVPPGFSLAAFAAAGKHAFAVGPPIRLRALVNADAIHAIVEAGISDDQKLALQADGRYLLEATVPDTYALRVWMLGFGEGIEVLGPDGVRHAIAGKLRDASNRYEGSAR